MAINVRAQGSPGAPAGAQVPAIPFVRAARKKSAAASTVTFSSLTSSSAATQLAPVQVPAAGYLRGLEILVSCTGVTAATYSATGDSPWSVIGQLSLVNSAGDNLVSSITGYQLYLLNKWGNFRTQAPFCDPYADNYYSKGATGFTFRLFVPIECDPSQAFTAVPNLAANKSFLLNLQVGSGSSVFASATGTGTVTFTIINHYWSQPAATNAAGVPQEIAPVGVGSTMLTQLQTAPVTSGDRVVQVQNVGNVLRALIFVLRNSSGVRIGASTDWPATSQIILNNDTLFYLTYNSWLSAMSETYGYGQAGTTADARGGYDTGVFVLPYFTDIANGYASPSNPRNQWLPTLDATLLQLRGTSFGANANTLEIVTQAVKPTSAAALYQPHV